MYIVAPDVDSLPASRWDCAQFAHFCLFTKGGGLSCLFIRSLLQGPAGATQVGFCQTTSAKEIFFYPPYALSVRVFTS